MTYISQLEKNTGKSLNEIIRQLLPHNTKSINLAYKSKYNRKRKNQVVLLMITNSEQSNEADKWHYVALKSVRTDD